MSAYTTKQITRKETIQMIKACRDKHNKEFEFMSDNELDEELHKYVYSEEYTDEVGLLYNYQIIN